MSSTRSEDGADRGSVLLGLSAIRQGLRPNLSSRTSRSDRAFHQDQRPKHDKYMAYLKERDPRERAELYRAYTKDANRVTRDLALPRNQVAREAESGAAKADDRSARRPATTPSARGSQATQRPNQPRVRVSRRRSCVTARSSKRQPPHRSRPRSPTCDAQARLISSHSRSTNPEIP